MFECVSCGYKDTTFSAAVDGVSKGALTYKAKCPVCGSFMVKATATSEEQLRLTIAPEQEAS